MLWVFGIDILSVIEGYIDPPHRGILVLNFSALKLEVLFS